jgi:hypothetical protein
MFLRSATSRSSSSSSSVAERRACILRRPAFSASSSWAFPATRCWLELPAGGPVPRGPHAQDLRGARVASGRQPRVHVELPAACRAAEDSADLPGGKQAVLIPRAGSRGRPVGLKLRESRRVKTRHSRTDRRGLALRQRHSRPLLRYRQMAHEADSDAPPFSGPVPGGGERLADRRGWIAEMVDAFAGLDVVEEFLVAHGVRKVRQRPGDP